MLPPSEINHPGLLIIGFAVFAAFNHQFADAMGGTVIFPDCSVARV